MATVVTSTYSNMQWRLAVLAETAVGTAKVASMHLIDVDAPVTISENPFRKDDPRTGVGRTIKASDVFVTEKGQIKEISFSGRADKTTFPILAENCMGAAEATGTIDIPFNFTGTAFEPGDVSADNLDTLTFALVQPETDLAIIFPGCIVSELSMTMDRSTNGGRMEFSCTAQTRHNPDPDATDPTFANSNVVYSTYYSMWEFGSATGQTQINDGDAADDIILAGYSLTINSNPKFDGLGLNGIPEIYNRGVPIIDVTGSCQVKWDANTHPYRQDYADGSTFDFYFTDNTTLASATVGFRCQYAKLTGDLNLTDVDDSAFIDIPFRASASTSGSILQLIV